MYQSDWVDDVPPNYIPGCEASSSDTPGPETQESCPFDCGVPCPPFCDSRVCEDSARLYAGAASEVEVAHRLAGEAEWVAASVEGALLGHKLRQLQPQSQYEVRARARNAGGWGDWTAPLSLETNGAVTAGQCIQDDAPCDDRDGEVLEIDYLYGGAGCAFSPTVELVGGNCFANDTGVNGTGLQPAPLTQAMPLVTAPATAPATSLLPRSTAAPRRTRLASAARRPRRRRRWRTEWSWR